MKAMVVRAARAPIVPEKRALPEPARGEVRVRVHACGVCHSDQFVTEGLWPGLVLPRVPGQEVAGVIDEVGEGVASLRRGDRVGVGGTAATTAAVAPASRASSSAVNLRASPA